MPSTKPEQNASDESGSAKMFSAASFAAIVSQAPNTLATQVNEQMRTPPVVAFYGFRGGAGRTTALAHVAATFASRQTNIVAVDLDLEAPGLHQVLDCPDLKDATGSLALLRLASLTTEDNLPTTLRLAPHLTKSRLDVGAPIRVLPAGRLDEQYLGNLEDLGVPLWHIGDDSNPLNLIIKQIKQELSPDAIFLDCRTGLSGLSASALFHVADLVICFLPVSSQSLDGLDVLLKAAKAAKFRRHGAPELLFVPSMVPEGADGRNRLETWFVPTLEQRYGEIILNRDLDGESEETTGELVPIVREGIEYRRGVALADHLRADFAQRAAGTYQPLVRRLEPLFSSTVSTPLTIRSETVLKELEAKADLKSLAFAEDASIDEVVKKFIEPSDFRAIIDRATWYVVGGKGAGKTWLYKYLLSATNQHASEMTYIEGHAPKNAILSANSFKELETQARLKPSQNHEAFWLLYAAWALLKKDPDLLPGLLVRLPADKKKLATKLAHTNETSLQGAIKDILLTDGVGTFAEVLIRQIDTELLQQGKPAVTLLYDGLDVGFGSDAKGLERRARFVDALIGAAEPLRGASKRLFFKIFLREDVRSEISVQNQSHLDAATVDLKWESRDIWLLALNIVAASKHYMESIHAIDRSAGINSWPQDDERRRQLLVPLWGAQMDTRLRVSSATFVERRTADGEGRLFPRTLVQLLHKAVEHQLKNETQADRVLRSQSIKEGYRSASKQRLEDLQKEYSELGPYLGALKDMKPTGTEAEIRSYMSRQMLKSQKKKRMGATPGALHAGPGGWHKVIEQLLNIGVLREYKRASGKNGEKKYEIALLYRPGLGIKEWGI